MPQQVPQVPTNVLIVEDDTVTRKLLSFAIESEPSLRLVGAFDKVKPALAWLKTGAVVDVLLTDLGLPDGSGIEVIHACARHYPNCDIMVITISSDEENILACIEAGASGYVLKDVGILGIVRALLEMCAGGSPISPLIARKVLARIRGEKKVVSTSVAEHAGEVIFTKRENTILELIARGETYGEVAKVLSLSVGTVQTHVKNIYTKLSVHSRGEAVFEAHRRGLLQMGLLKAKN